MLAIFFNDDSPVIDLSHDINISSIKECISDIISLYRDSIRMYIGLNGNVQLSGTDCYKVDGVGRVGGMFSHFEIVPIAFDTCGTADDVLDMLEMLAYCRKVISGTDTYKTLMSHGYISYIPYFEDREDVSFVNSVVHHINNDFKYYRLCDLGNGITCRTLPSNVYTVRAFDCMIYFTVSCKLFLHKKMGSSFFNPNVLDKILYDALYAYGKYIGYLS